MSALRDRRDLADQVILDNFLFGGLDLDDVQTFVGKFFWRWYAENQNDVIVTVGKWFVKFNVRVRDLRPLFVRLFGDEPTGASVQ